MIGPGISQQSAMPRADRNLHAARKRITGVRGPHVMGALPVALQRAMPSAGMHAHGARKAPGYGRPGPHVFAGLGHPLYVNGQLFQQPVTISHVPGAMGDVDPSMGAIGSYVAYAPHLGADDPLPGSTRASLPPGAPAPATDFISPIWNVWKYVAPVSALACAYHGYKRNRSILWALWWGFVGSMPITPVIALAQGFGEPRHGLTPNKRSGYRRLGPGVGMKKWKIYRSVPRTASGKTSEPVRIVEHPSFMTREEVEAELGSGEFAVSAARRKNGKRKRKAKR